MNLERGDQDDEMRPTPSRADDVLAIDCDMRLVMSDRIGGDMAFFMVFIAMYLFLPLSWR